jgi:replicative superfamily II helicase
MLKALVLVFLLCIYKFLQLCVYFHLCLDVSDLGRTASHFYIKYATVEVFNDQMEEVMTECDILNMMSLSQEFEQLKVGSPACLV